LCRLKTSILSHNTACLPMICHPMWHTLPMRTSITPHPYPLSQPTLRREGNARAHGCVFQGRKARGVATDVYLRKTSEKLERCGLLTLMVKGSGVVFMHGEGISTPRAHHKGRQPLIKCANMSSKCFIFPFLCLFVFLCFLCFFVFFLSFCG